MKKVICKIFEYYPETEQFDVAIGRLHSHKSIDEHIRVGVSCDRLDMTDFESFKYSLVNRLYENIQDDDEKEPILDDNVPIDVDELDIQKLIGKVFLVDYIERSTRLLKMRRVYL